MGLPRGAVPGVLLAVHEQVKVDLRKELADLRGGAALLGHAVAKAFAAGLDGVLWQLVPDRREAGLGGLDRTPQRRDQDGVELPACLEDGVDLAPKVLALADAALDERRVEVELLVGLAPIPLVVAHGLFDHVVQAHAVPRQEDQLAARAGGQELARASWPLIHGAVQPLDKAHLRGRLRVWPALQGGHERRLRLAALRAHLRGALPLEQRHGAGHAEQRRAQ
mmetsp:Transcript_20680/g.65989  ORF Transcript_20680/g.65989 Transcript_20680/m.65989 type:complete len:223 (-) Transcript_20680:242-910(-)